MKTISIDVESYSGNDLGKCGVYKYVQHPDFDILLFGYAVDGVLSGWLIWHPGKHCRRKCWSLCQMKQ